LKNSQLKSEFIYGDFEGNMGRIKKKLMGCMNFSQCIEKHQNKTFNLIKVIWGRP